MSLTFLQPVLPQERIVSAIINAITQYINPPFYNAYIGQLLLLNKVPILLKCDTRFSFE